MTVHHTKSYNKKNLTRQLHIFFFYILENDQSFVYNNSMWTSKNLERNWNQVFYSIVWQSSVNCIVIFKMSSTVRCIIFFICLIVFFLSSLTVCLCRNTENYFTNFETLYIYIYICYLKPVRQQWWQQVLHGCGTPHCPLLWNCEELMT